MTRAAFSYFERQLTANETVTINAVGSSVRCTKGTATFDIEPDEGNKIELQAGLGFTGSRPFRALRITNGGTAQTIGIYVGDGAIDDNRLVGAISISGGLAQAGNPTAAYGNVTIGVTAAVIKAANTDRSNILIQNLGAADIYIGSDASVTTSNGIKLAAGGSATFAAQTALYGISGTAGQDVRYFEEDAI